MKKVTEKNILEHFKNHPKEKCVYVASDETFFPGRKKQEADAHQRSIDAQKSVERVINEAFEKDFEDENVAAQEVLDEQIDTLKKQVNEQETQLQAGQQELKEIDAQIKEKQGALDAIKLALDEGQKQSSELSEVLKSKQEELDALDKAIKDAKKKS